MVFLAVVATALHPFWSSASASPVQQPPERTEPVVELADQTTWVAPGEVFHMRVDVDQVPPEATVSLDIHPLLGSRREFDETLANGAGGTSISTPFSQTIGEIVPEPDGTLPLSFDPQEAGLSEGGVYPVGVRVEDETGQRIAGFLSYLLFLPPPFDEFTPLTVAPILEVGASPGLQPDGTVHIEPEELAQVGTRIDALEQIDSPVSVAPVPETLDALARLAEDTSGTSPGTGTQEDSDEVDDAESTRDDTDLLDDLGTAFQGKEVLARPYVDLDLEAWAAANLVNEAAPEADAGAEAVRSNYGREPHPGIWLTEETVGPTEAATWRFLGASRAILPSTAVAGVPGWDDSVTPPVQLPDGPVGFVSDDVLVDRLLSIESPLDVQRFVSELAMVWFEWPARHRTVVLRIPAQAPIEPDLVAEALDEMGHPQAVNPVTATDLFEMLDSTEEMQPLPVELQPKAASDDLSWMVEQLSSAKQALAGLRETIEAGQLVTSLERSILIAPGAQTPSAARARYLDRVQSATREVADGINAPETFRITLTAKESTIPLTINNDLGQEVTVRVHLASNQLEFPDGSEFDLVVPPEGIREDLRVRTRTSGAFPLHIRLTSPDGNVVVDETSFNVRSTTFSGVGLALSLGAGLFLVVWWTRHWRRTRRQASDDSKASANADSD